MTPSVLLVHPPLVVSSEPPAGLARLAGALRPHPVACTVLDANLEGLMHLMGIRADSASGISGSGDTWTRRARRGFGANLHALKTDAVYRNLDRYQRAVRDLNRVLAMSVPPDTFRVSLSDYEDRCLSPVRSRDLIRAAESPQTNPFYEYFGPRLTALMEGAQPGWVGFSLNYLSQALCCFAMAGFLKRVLPAVKIVLGGGLVTSWMQRPGWRNPFAGLVDEWIAGPGEAPLPALLGISSDPPDALPARPDYSPFPREDYLAPGFILPYSASSGCYWRRCAFCPEKAEANAYRPLPDERVVVDLQRYASGFAGGLADRCGASTEPYRAGMTGFRDTGYGGPARPTMIHLLDNALRPSLLRRLAMDPPGAPWYGFARLSPDLAEPGFCRALRRAGCVMLQLGVESGSQRVLDQLDKGIELGTVSEALENIHRAGIVTYVYLLFGTPQEQEPDAWQTLEFVVRNRERIDFLNAAIFNLPAFGPDTQRMETGEFYEGDLSLYRTFRHPTGWDRPRVRSFLGRAFKRHAAVAAILRRDPPYFGSNHAPFFGMFRTTDDRPTSPLCP